MPALLGLRVGRSRNRHERGAHDDVGISTTSIISRSRCIMGFCLLANHVPDVVGHDDRNDGPECCADDSSLRPRLQTQYENGAWRTCGRHVRPS
jgi:hypothetical protein